MPNNYFRDAQQGWPFSSAETNELIIKLNLLRQNSNVTFFLNTILDHLLLCATPSCTAEKFVFL